MLSTLVLYIMLCYILHIYMSSPKKSCMAVLKFLPYVCNCVLPFLVKFVHEPESNFVCTWNNYYLLLFVVCRSVGRTQMNEESSRSHCVFTLRIFGVNEVHTNLLLLTLIGAWSFLLIWTIFCSGNGSASARSAQSNWSCGQWAP